MTHTLRDAAVEELVLRAMARAPRYHRWLVGRFGPDLGRSVVELGAGDGTVTRALLDAGVARVTAVEPHPGRHGRLAAELGGDPRVRVLAGDSVTMSSNGLGGFGGAGAAVLYVNVLEHVDDDVGELRRAAALAGPGGRVCLFVPALPWLYSRLDAELGHHRRYTRTTLARSVTTAGLVIERMEYFDRLGALAWWLAYTLAGRRITPWAAATYDRLVPVLRVMESVVPLPFGKNLVCVCAPPGTGARPG